jgi:hypothetical protein
MAKSHDKSKGEHEPRELERDGVTVRKHHGLFTHVVTHLRVVVGDPYSGDATEADMIPSPWSAGDGASYSSEDFVQRTWRIP